MSYTDVLAQLADYAETNLVELWRRWQAGQLTEAEFVAAAVAAMARTGSTAVGLADLALAAFLTADRRAPVPTLGLLPEAEPDRLRTGLLALLAVLPDLPDPEARVGRHGRAEALSAAQDAYGTGMREAGVQAWTRVLNSGACELCRDLAGPVLPASADMYHHPGCGCTQRPVTKENPA